MKKENIRNIAGVGIFAALSIVVSFATSFLKIGFLSLDAGDIIIVLSSFIWGAPSGVAISLVSSLVSFLYSGTGFWGMLMDFASSAAFALVAGVIYSGRRDFKHAIIGIYVAVVAVTALMMPLNILITPLYTGAPTGYVISLIPTLLLPFNFAKTLFNGSAVLLLYKSVVRAMRAARLAPPSRSEKSTATVREGKNPTHAALIIGGVAILVAVIVLVLITVLTDYDFKVEARGVWDGIFGLV